MGQRTAEEVVVVLPLMADKVLFQLRDFNKEISLPGQWGFFGGSIDKGELPIDAAFREIEEELCITPSCLCFLGSDFPIEGVLAYIFSFDLGSLLSSISLQEGSDLALISLEDLGKKSFFSPRLKKQCPIISLPFIVRTMKKALDQS